MVRTRLPTKPISHCQKTLGSPPSHNSGGVFVGPPLVGCRGRVHEQIATLKGKGVKFHTFPDGEAKKWKAANPDFFGDFIKNQDAKGRGADAKKTIEIWREVVK